METTSEPKPNESAESLQSYLDSLTSQYATPAKKNETSTVTEAQQSIVQPPLSVTPAPATAPAPTSTDPEAPYGRYQRGKKKGMPREAPYISVKALPSTPVQVQTQKVDAKLSGMLIDGGLFLTLINIAVPLLIAVVHNAVEKDKKKHINPEKLKLTNDQKKELDPVCDAVMKQVQLTGNPLMILLIGLMTAYGLNFMALKMSQS